MNYPEFCAAAAKTGTTNRALARAIGISEQALYNKLRGNSEFKNSEIKKISKEMKLNMDAVNAIFFDNEVN